MWNALSLSLCIIVLGLLIGCLTLLRRQGHQRVNLQESVPFTPEYSENVTVATIPLVDHDKTVSELNDQVMQLRAEITRVQREAQAEVQRIQREAGEKVTLQLHELEVNFLATKRAEAKRTAERSRTALVAKIAEHMTPYLYGFPFNPKDARHWGEVFDFLIYDGLEESGGSYINEVVFLEVKTKRTGARVTNRREKALREVLKAGRVRYQVWVPELGDIKDQPLGYLPDE